MPIHENPEQAEGDTAVSDEGGAPTEVTMDTDTRPIWEKVQDKTEELTTKVARYFEDKNDAEGESNPIVNPPHTTNGRRMGEAPNHAYTICCLVSAL